MPHKTDTSLEDTFNDLARELNPAKLLNEIIPKPPSPLELLAELEGK